MGKISNYTQVSASKLADKLVCDQEDSGVTSTKSVSIEQIGNAVNALQVRSDLDTQAQTIVSAINELTTYIPVWNNTASGAIATFDTSLALPLQDCTIDINAVQESGTPTPSSPKLISGFTGANIKVVGANLWDEVYRNGYYNNSGAFVSQGSTICNTNPIVVDGSMQLYIHSGSYHISLFFYDVNGNYLSNLYHKENTVITVPASAKTMNWTADYGEGSTYNNDISINYPATDTAYHAYNANTTAITWQDEVGTVYGGTLDVTSGVLTVTHGFITFDGSDDEIWNDGTIRYSIEIADCERTAGRLEVLCNRGVFSSSGGIEGTVFVTNTFLYYYPPTSITSLANFKTWLGSNNLVVVYPLETPVTYQLTPTQISAIVGTNNVFTDTNGNTSVVYACSLKDYID